MSAVEFVVLIRTVSEANMRESHFTKSNRTKKIRGAANLAAHAVSRAPWAGPIGTPIKLRIRGALAPYCTPTVPLTITMTRVAPRLIDSDNAWGSQKGIRDGISDALNIDDGDHRLTWRVEQRRGLPEQYETEVRIEPTPECEWKPAPTKRARKKRAA